MCCPAVGSVDEAFRFSIAEPVGANDRPTAPKNFLGSNQVGNTEPAGLCLRSVSEGAVNANSPLRQGSLRGVVN